MQLTDFHFDLPPELIARYPLQERSASRLMYIDGAANTFQHRHFRDIVDFLKPHDLLIFNNTMVIPARLYGQKPTGGRVELLVERILDDKRMLAQVRASKAVRTGDPLMLPGDVVLRVLGRHEQFYELCYEQQSGNTLLEVIEALGQIPLPPYMHRHAEDSDKERYQTVYAKHKGSVAAPTAGFHFDEALLHRLKGKHVDMGYLTLHIGAGTFAPIRVNNISEHQMHAEYLDVSAALCEQVANAKAHGGRIIAVGTTSLRALETAAQNGELAPYRGDTRIFMTPGHIFRTADVLITNLHLPQSTLMMLVCAFGGHEVMMQAYREALAQSYRFYSYGDAMWITKAGGLFGANSL